MTVDPTAWLLYLVALVFGTMLGSLVTYGRMHTKALVRIASLETQVAGFREDIMQHRDETTKRVFEVVRHVDELMKLCREILEVARDLLAEARAARGGHNAR